MTPIAVVVLSALVIMLVAEHRTPGNTPNPSKLAVSNETLPDLAYIDGNESSIIGKIGLAGDARDKGCEMSPEEFAKFYPPLLGWIRTTLDSSAYAGQTVASHNFSRLPLYFTEKTLDSTKVVLVDPLPMPPLSSMGLGRFADFVRGDFEGITYMDTVFLKPSQSDSENLYFHELVHAIQWRLLGPDRFLFSYANGLECFGYRHSPLEAMAYDAEEMFASSTAIFNVEKMVADKLGLVNQ
jgi:hypothetical protein